MITFLSLASTKEENSLIKEQIRFQAARLTEESWNYQFFENLNLLCGHLTSEPLLDMISWDVTMEEALKSLELMRPLYKQAFLLVVADSGTSPKAYLKPSIAPSSLLLKPVTKENLIQVTEEMFEAFSERFSKEEVSDSFVINTREGKQYISLGQIYYVEAREKKIYIRTKQEEFGFYETIEHIEKQLPENFSRCHRSYIVNRSKIRMLETSQNTIVMQDGIRVPLSRSYKKQIKDYQHVRES